MTFDIIFAQMLRVALVIGAFQLLLFVIGSNMYEIRQIRQQRSWRQHPFARRLRQRPLLTIMLPAGKHDGDAILPSLLSIGRGSYKNVEVIIIDQTRNRTAAQTADGFSVSFPSVPVRVVTKKTDTRQAGTAADALRRHGHGQLVAVLPAGCTFDSKSLATAAHYFNDDKQLSVLRPAVRVGTNFSSFGVMRRYQMLLSLNLQKGRQLFAGAVVPGDLMVCRRQLLTGRSRTLKISAVYYADDVTAYRAAAPYIWSPLTQTFVGLRRGASQWLGQWPARFRDQSIWKAITAMPGLLFGLSAGAAVVLIPLLTAYFVYMAVALGEPLYLLSGAALLTVLLLFAIWEDRQIKWRQKLAYSLGIPLAFSYLIGVSLVSAAAVVISLAVWPVSDKMNVKP